MTVKGQRRISGRCKLRHRIRSKFNFCTAIVEVKSMPVIR